MILLKLFLLAFSLLGYCLFFHRKIGIPVEFTPFFTVTSLMVCLYALGYVGSLEFNSWGLPVGFNPLTMPTVPILYFGVRVLFVLGWCCGLIWLWTIRRNSSDVWNELFNPALIFFFVGLFLIFFPLQPYLMRHTDDIHHWGLAVKCMSIYHSLPGIDSRLTYAEYPPGVPLFHYYISTFTNFREGTLLFSHNLMLLAGTVVLMYRIPWKYFYILFLIPFFAFVLQNLFMHGPRYLMVDTTLAVFLGASLYLYSSSALTAVPFPQRLIPLISSSAALVLTKHVGLIFALILCSVVFADELVALSSKFIRRNREPSVGDKNHSKRSFRRTILPLIVLFASPFVISESWNSRCERCPFPQKDLSRPGIAQNTERAFRQIVNEVPPAEWPRALFDRSVRERWSNAFENALPEKRVPIVALFREAVFRQELNGFDYISSREGRNLTTFSMTVALLALTALLLFSPSLREFRIRYIVTNLVLLVGAGGYLFFMLLVYLFAFDEISAIRLASFQRYVGCYFHGWLLSLLGMTSLCFKCTEPRWNMKRLAILAVSVLLLYLFFLAMILVFSFEEAVGWGAAQFLLYVAVYFRFVFLTMLIGLVFCFQKPETNVSPITNLCPHIVWVVLLVFIFMKAEFAFRVEQTSYATEYPFRQEVRECLRQIELEKDKFQVIRVIFETDDPVGDCAMHIADSYEYEMYPDRSIALETFGVDYYERLSRILRPQLGDKDRAYGMATPEEWSTSLIEEGVEGLFLHKTNDLFWERYGKLFENGEDACNDGCRFYRVTVSHDKSRIVLIRLPSNAKTN